MAARSHSSQTMAKHSSVFHKGVDEEVANGPGPLDHISLADEWRGRKAKSFNSFQAEC